MLSPCKQIAVQALSQKPQQAVSLSHNINDVQVQTLFSLLSDICIEIGWIYSNVVTHPISDLHYDLLAPGWYRYIRG